MATKSKTEVATQQAAFSTTAPAYINNGPARGSEEVGANDMVLPRLEIVQALSPIKEENEAAKEGFLFNSVTQEILGDHVFFVPVYFRLEYLVWKDLDQGGGFMGSFPTEADAQARKQAAVADGEDPDLIEIVDTPVQYGLRITPDQSVCEQIVISMAKTKAKVSRKWNSMIQIAGGDRFSRVYKIATFKDENKKGQKFYNYTVQPAGFTPEAVYRKSEELYGILKAAGGARVAHDSVAGDTSGEQSDRGDI